jgi:hypothetical protein
MPKIADLQVGEQGEVEGGAKEDNGEGDQLLPQAERLQLRGRHRQRRRLRARLHACMH